jgi:hypothetical protein
MVLLDIYPGHSGKSFDDISDLNALIFINGEHLRNHFGESAGQAMDLLFEDVELLRGAVLPVVDAGQFLRYSHLQEADAQRPDIHFQAVLIPLVHFWRHVEVGRNSRGHVAAVQFLANSEIANLDDIVPAI